MKERLAGLFVLTPERISDGIRTFSSLFKSVLYNWWMYVPDKHLKKKNPESLLNVFVKETTVESKFIVKCYSSRMFFWNYNCVLLLFSDWLLKWFLSNVLLFCFISVVLFSSMASILMRLKPKRYFFRPIIAPDTSFWLLK